MELDPRLGLQVRVSKMLGYGFAFSVVSLGGFGSLIAFFIGLRAMKLINKSGGGMSGVRMAWWCIVVGGLGLGILFPDTVWKIYKAVNK